MLRPGKKLSGQVRTYDGMTGGPALAGHGSTPLQNNNPKKLAHPAVMRSIRLGWIWLLWVTAVTVVLGADDSDAVQDQAQEGLVRVGMLVYGNGKTGVCFSSRFLSDVARQTSIRTERRFETVDLIDPALFEYPLMVMSGTGDFGLTKPERENLSTYLQRGGFLLASAGCSNRPWAASFERLFDELYPQADFQPLALSHPVFHSLFKIDRLPTRKGSNRAAVLGLKINGQLAVLYSPVGLNDTGRAGAGCCCCGGSELRNASAINANVLVYVLTH